MIKKMEVFDPAMCCSTGVCGSTIDPCLTQFSADLEWAQSLGVSVNRYNLAQQPRAFAENQIVKSALEIDSNCLPLILVRGKIVKQGGYPSRNELAGLLGIPISKESAVVFTPEVEELVAIGASISAGCMACFKHHHDKARELGISGEVIAEAVNIALVVKKTAGEQILKFADNMLYPGQNGGKNTDTACCPPSTSPLKKTCCG